MERSAGDGEVRGVGRSQRRGDGYLSALGMRRSIGVEEGVIRTTGVRRGWGCSDQWTGSSQDEGAEMRRAGVDWGVRDSTRTAHAITVYDGPQTIL